MNEQRVQLYDLVLPWPAVTAEERAAEAGAWWAWRAAGGNLVTDEGRRVPWPAPEDRQQAGGDRVPVHPVRRDVTAGLVAPDEPAA